MKKLFIYLFCILVLTSFVYAYSSDFNYTDGSLSSNASIRAGFPVTNLNDFDITTSMYDEFPSAESYYQSDMGSDFIFEYVMLNGTDDGSGAIRSYDIAILVDGVTIGRVSHDGTGKQDLFLDIPDTQGQIIRLETSNITADADVQIFEWMFFGSNVSGGDTPGITPSLILNTSMINGTISNQTTQIIFYNGTSTNNSNTYDCSILVNQTINQTETINDLSLNHNFTIEFNYEFRDWMNFTVNCSNENTSKLISMAYYIDVIEPFGVCDLSNGTTYYDNTNLVYQCNFTDVNLFWFNFTDTLNGVIVNYHEVLDINDSLYMLNLSNSTENLGIGNHTVNIKIADSHTNKKLKEKGYISYDGIYFHNIRFYCDDFKSYEIKDKGDRLSYKIKFNEKDNLHTCYYENLNYFKVSRTPYINHFVDIYKFVWLDEPNGELTTESNKLKINYWFDEKTDELETQTIGELNIYETFYVYNIIEAPSLTDIYLIELINQTQTTNTNLSNLIGGTEMIGFFIFIGVFIILAFVTKHKFLLSASGVIMLWFSIYLGSRMVEQTSEVLANYYKYGTWGFLVLGIVCIFLGIAFQLIETLELDLFRGNVGKFIRNNKEKRKFNNDFYRNY